AGQGLPHRQLSVAVGHHGQGGRLRHHHRGAGARARLRRSLQGQRGQGDGGRRAAGGAEVLHAGRLQPGRGGRHEVIRALLMLAVLVVASEAPAASFTLTEADKRAAIHTGERSVTSEAFDREWRVSNGGGETATVVTPFHRLAVAARHATFKNDPLKPTDVDRLVKE